jgi:hypothetical protein
MSLPEKSECEIETRAQQAAVVADSTPETVRRFLGFAGIPEKCAEVVVRRSIFGVDGETLTKALIRVVRATEHVERNTTLIPDARTGVANTDASVVRFERLMRLSEHQMQPADCFESGRRIFASVECCTTFA